MAIICSTIGGVIGMYQPYTDDFTVAILCLSVNLFSGGILAPILTGCQLASVEPELRTQAYAVANILYNLIGYIPAPFVYGYITQHTGGETSRWGLKITTWTQIPSILFVVVAQYYRPDLENYWSIRKE